MIKILFLVESLDVGGTELSLLKWIKHCDRSRFLPEILSFREGVLHDQFTGAGAPVRIINKREGIDLFFVFRLRDAIKKLGPQIVHCRNGIPAICYGIAAAKLAKVPVIASIHGRTHYQTIGAKQRLWFRLMNLCDAVITVTSGIKDDVRKYGGVPSDKIHVVYNGISEETVESLPGKQRQEIRKELDIPDDAFLIGTVGSLRPIKGHRYLIEAVKNLIPSIPQFRLILIGQGEEEEKLHDLVRTGHLEKHIVFMGYRPDASRLIAGFDVFVLPSLSEGFPNVLLEAALQRIPIVATKVGGVGEIFEDGKTAILVERKNANVLSEAVLRVFKDRGLGERLSSAAYKQIISRFGLDNFINGYCEIYQKILALKI